MIAHVAEAGENRGRVVVRLGAYVPSSPAALAAAVHVAQAFQSSIEGLFIEDPAVFDAANRPFVRALSFAGVPREDFTSDALAFDTSHFTVAVQRALADAAKAARVAFSARVVRDDVINALSTACTRSGPWNMVVIAEPILDDDRAVLLSAAATQVFGTTGTIAVGRSAVWRQGPILVALEDTERLTGMLRAAEQLAGVCGDDICIQPVGSDEVALDWLEGEVRLLLGDTPRIRILPRPLQTGSDQVWVATLAAIAPRMVIARHGGQLMPTDQTVRPLAGLRCPVFMVH